MIELIDDSNRKIMVMPFCTVSYSEYKYFIYCTRRVNDEINIFFSKIIKTSEGDALSNEFVNGEKEIIEKVIKKMLSNEDISKLEKDDFKINNDITLEGIQRFDFNICYITTIPLKKVKECMIFYNLVKKDYFSTPTIEVLDESYFNKGFISNIGLIILGIVVLIICIIGIFIFIRGGI